MRLEIISYSKYQDHWVCRDEYGKTHRVDLAVCGTDDGRLIGKSPNDFNGRFVTVGYLSPYEEIADETILEARHDGKED
jgi:hypothetical protein